MITKVHKVLVHLLDLGFSMSIPFFEQLDD